MKRVVVTGWCHKCFRHVLAVRAEGDLRARCHWCDSEVDEFDTPGHDV